MKPISKRLARNAAMQWRRVEARSSNTVLNQMVEPRPCAIIRNSRRVEIVYEAVSGWVVIVAVDVSPDGSVKLHKDRRKTVKSWPSRLPTARSSEIGDEAA